MTNTQMPLPIGLVSLNPPRKRVSDDTLQAAKELLREAEAGDLVGLAMVCLKTEGRYSLKLRGDALIEGNKMGLIGLVATLQRMAMDLHE